jgi:hypothetical protein
MNYADYINFGNMDFMRWDKPLQSIYIEFIRKNAAEILDYGEFEALRRWILSMPDCFPLPVTPENSHKATREFYKNLKKEQKEKRL